MAHVKIVPIGSARDAAIDAGAYARNLAALEERERQKNAEALPPSAD